MRQSLALSALLALAATARAAQVTFHVVAPGATTVQVSVNGQLTALTAADPTLPIFTGAAETGADTKYKYVAGGTAETFDRELPSGKTETYNDFLDRPVTYANIPELPWPIENDPQWTRSGPKQPIFDSNYIPTIFVNGNSADLDSLIANPVATQYPVTLTFVLASEVKTFSNVSFGIHGAGKKNNNAKQSWNWSLSSGDTYQNRSFFKIRHQEEDPTQIREKLYADIARAMGTYANEANMVRLFINNDGFGTFNLLDDVTQYSYISAMFYGGNPPAQMGALFDGASGASFQYSPTGDGYYSWIKNALSPEEPTAVGPLCELWNRTDKTNDAAIAEVNKQLDLDPFMRFMVLEYLTGDWDGYWEEQTNDGLYRDPTQENKWYYLAQDFDATFGVNLPTADPTFIEWSYKNFPTNFPGGVMINGLLQNTNQQKTFETYLKNTVQVLFNNVTLTNRILKYHDFILPDLAWDRNITQRSPGINYGWTFPQVTENLWQSVAAPNANGGGAMFGLIEWIAKKSNAVAKEFAITITTTPVGPPTNSSQPNAGGNNTSSGSSKPSDTTGSNKGNAAGHALPQALATFALVGTSLVALLL
ncbi:coth protein-domain-containing protein [Gamsiella multidivaricata]|uniref:coth protein-domain-containing protein n=1 Tax=Gamsiella multidivaricata TaxID=101098 RepID=UPI00221F7577|nr:coth protein-domain-containing protein [Gamsiella multidivaricata]KAG0355062.1 hypothetical protein BGZ54_001319 [Gamsiella multidivaricata]KAI7831644.1 coth protein-domain-containing protein [Gamsiella multidivaricata]